MTIYCVRVKEGVQFHATIGPYKGVIAPGGFVILGALAVVARIIGHDITITSACDGEHSGPDDPHHRGEAYDVRSHDLPSAENAVQMLSEQLGARFYAFLEDEGTANEHIHVQVDKGTAYPPTE